MVNDYEPPPRLRALIERWKVEIDDPESARRVWARILEANPEAVERFKARQPGELSIGYRPARSRWRIALDLLVRVLVFIVAIAALSALAGCDREDDEPDPSALRIVVHEALNPGTFGGDVPLQELPAEVLDACALLELACVVERDRARTRRAWVLVLTPPLFGGTQDGALVLSSKCERVSWSTRHGARIAHELGRAFGLVEVDDPGNVMHRLGRVAHVEPEQIYWVETETGWWCL